MAAILRDRINDLLTANADLEREVARLRYADAGNKSGADENQMHVKNVHPIHLVKVEIFPTVNRVQIMEYLQ